ATEAFSRSGHLTDALRPQLLEMPAARSDVEIATGLGAVVRTVFVDPAALLFATVETAALDASVAAVLQVDGACVPTLRRRFRMRERRSAERREHGDEREGRCESYRAPPASESRVGADSCGIDGVELTLFVVARRETSELEEGEDGRAAQQSRRHDEPCADLQYGEHNGSSFSPDSLQQTC